MKYWILKIVGILGLFFTPFIYIGYADQHLESMNSRYMNAQWGFVYEGLLIFFLLITIAGFARPIAKLKALIDFHFDFDDDQDLDGYPKLHTFAIIKRIIFWTVSFGALALVIIANWFPVLNDYIVGSLIFVASLNILLSLINIIICICKQINPIYADIAVIFGIIGLVLYFVLPELGVLYILTMIIVSPIFAVALLYIAFAVDDLISFDEVFDWICADEYNVYYKKLCEKEKEQEAQAKIEKKVSVRNARKTRRKNIKGKKKSSTKKEKQ